MRIKGRHGSKNGVRNQSLEGFRGCQSWVCTPYSFAKDCCMCWRPESKMGRNKEVIRPRWLYIQWVEKWFQCFQFATLKLYIF